MDICNEENTCADVIEDKPFPSIPNSFSAKFAWNMMIVNTTYYIEEVFSEELDKGYMLIENMVGPGIRSQMITYGRTGQYLFINGQICHTCRPQSSQTI